MRKRIAALVSMLMLAAFGPAAIAAHPAAAAASCNSNFEWRSSANGKFVSAELGDIGIEYGVLRARADTAGPWEKFTLCAYPTYYTVRSNANGKYVTVVTDPGYGTWQYMLRATSSSVGENEKFEITQSNSVGYWGSVASGLYVSAELGYSNGEYAMLRARAGTAGPWESFNGAAACC